MTNLQLIPQIGAGRKVYSTEEVARFLGVNKRRVENWAAERKLHRSFPGKLFGYTQDDVNAFLNKLNNGKV